MPFISPTRKKGRFYVAETILYSQDHLSEIMEGIRLAQTRLEEAAALLSRIDTSGEAGGDLFATDSGCTLSGLAGIQRLSSSSVSAMISTYRAVCSLYAEKTASVSAAVSRVSSEFESTEYSLLHKGLEGDIHTKTFDGQGAANDEFHSDHAGIPNLQDYQDWIAKSRKKNTIDQYDSASMSNKFNMDMCECMLDFSQLAYDLFDPEGVDWRKSEAQLRDMGFDPANVVACDYPECIICSRTNEDGTPTVVISFRGSSDLDDWAQNFMAFTTPDDIHAGFELRVRALLAKMDSIKLSGIEGSPSLADFLTSVKSGEKANILLTGHSLGGAEAQLLNYHLLDQGVPAEAVTGYTFASPHPFESALSEYLGNYNLIDALVHPNYQAMKDANCYNIINPADPVPKVGANIIGGANIGTDIKIDLRHQERQDHIFEEHSRGRGSQLDTYRQYIENDGLHKYTNT